MTAGQIVGLCLGLGLGLPTILVGLYWTADDTRHRLWPRGLRWLPPALDRLADRVEWTGRAWFWPERDEMFSVTRRTRHLEHLDESFRHAALLYGVAPEWTGADDEHGRWIAYGRMDGTCSCGYVTECSIWCGNGHETGACPDNHVGSLRWPGC